jgi:23S rRNA pseudouridine2605 synthase
MSEGLLVMSTDGELIQNLTHPSRNHDKEYLVGLAKELSSQAVQEMQSGKLRLDENILAPMKVTKITANELQEWSFLRLSNNLNWYKFILSEGRNNQIRRACQLFGSGVTRLIRIKQGDFVLTKALQEEKWIEV